MQFDYDMMGGMWFGWWWVWVFFILALGSLAYLVYISSRSRQRSEHGIEEDAIEIAKQRLAKGEISSKEFDEIKSRLK